MPEPLATSKRKFHKLLDSLSRHANASAYQPAGSEPEIISARDRLIAASERVSKRRRVSEQSGDITYDGSIRSISTAPKKLPVSKHPRTSGPTASAPLPAFSPWSQESFLQRLQTFSSVSRWHLKPEAINEVVWAKRGWSCVGVNTVACLGSCERRVVVDLSTSKGNGLQDQAAVDSISQDNDAADNDLASDDGQDTLLQALTERYVHEIVQAHDANCSWRKTGCKDDIYRLQLVRPAIWRPQLRHRVDSLIPLTESIRAIPLKPAASAFAPTEYVMLVRDKQDDTEETIDRSTLSEAVTIALHGWHGISDAHADLLQCSCCFQRVGLWMYQPGYSRRTDQDDSDQRLDLLDLHRDYCPWKSAISQCASGSLSGLNACEILDRVAHTWIREQQRSQHISTLDTELASEAVDDHIAKPPREEEDRLDREREGRLQKLKRLLTLKKPRAVPLSV